MGEYVRPAKTALSTALAATPLAYFPVRVRQGFAKGARWTLLPFSANWRRGGSEDDVAVAASYVPRLDGAVFWDFGAHFGIHTIGLAMRVGPKGQAVAFEPDPVAYRRLVKHVSMMKNLRNVITFEAAASDETAQSTLHFPPELGPGSACSYVLYHSSDDTPESSSITVRTIAPDDLVASNTIRAPDFIKVDVQGHGAKALAGSINSIQKSWPVIAFSQHSEAELNGIRELLEPLGYIPVRNFSGRQAGWKESAVLVAKNHDGTGVTDAP